MLKQVTKEGEEGVGVEIVKDGEGRRCRVINPFIASFL